jgi:hypothetical protein
MADNKELYRRKNTGVGNSVDQAIQQLSAGFAASPTHETARGIIEGIVGGLQNWLNSALISKNDDEAILVADLLASMLWTDPLTDDSKADLRFESIRNELDKSARLREWRIALQTPIEHWSMEEVVGEARVALAWAIVRLLAEGIGEARVALAQHPDATILVREFLAHLEASSQQESN